MEFQWIRFDPEGELPAERRDVLVRLDCGPEFHSGAVVVGYLRYHSGGAFFVCSGIRGPWTVTHWCDCLGDDWNAPGWATRQTGEMRRAKEPLHPDTK